MKLSSLQKYILVESFSRKGKISANVFLAYYKKQKTKPKKSSQYKIITRSLDRLIERGLAVGFGEKTQKKWYVSEIKLTLAGKKLAKKLSGEQIKFKI